MPLVHLTAVVLLAIVDGVGRRCRRRADSDSGVARVVENIHSIQGTSWTFDLLSCTNLLLIAMSWWCTEKDFCSKF